MAISFVRYDDFYNAAAGTTIANDTALNTTTGNFLVVFTGNYPNRAVTGVTDTAGNTYVKATGAEGGFGTVIWYAENIIGNASNITTVTFAASTTYKYISVAEFSGVAISSSLLDTSSQSNDAATSHSSGVATSTSVGDLIIGGFNADGFVNITLGATFSTLSSNLTAVLPMAEYKVLGVAGDYAATCTTPDSVTSSMVCAIFAIAAPPAGTKQWINVDDSWRQLTEAWVNVDDSWRKVKEAWINVDDVWRKLYSI